jgi:hypothetical protein
MSSQMSLPGAEGAVLEGTKDIMLAAMTEQRVEGLLQEDGGDGGDSADAEKARNLSAKVLRIKGEITRDAIKRQAAMHDKDESLALTAAIKALQQGDADQATSILKDRLNQVRGRRRRALRGDESDSDDSDNSDSDSGGADGPAGGDRPGIPAQQSQREWESIVEGRLSAACAPAAGGPATDPARIADLRTQLDRGAHLLAGAQPGAAALSAAILGGLEKLRVANISPFFIWMFDEPWQLLRSFWADAEELLGGPCVLEPTFAAYHLNPKLARQARGKYVGTNFGLPHRDYTFTDSHMANGKPKILTMWVPVTAVTSENGCMYVVPKEFDDNYDKDSVYGEYACVITQIAFFSENQGLCELTCCSAAGPLLLIRFSLGLFAEHMVVQTTGWMAGKSHLSFPVAGARPLAPAAAGALCAWYGNVIHWGAHCHSSEEDNPRASVAWVFRLASATPSAENPPLARGEVRIATPTGLPTNTSHVSPHHLLLALFLDKALAHETHALHDLVVLMMIVCLRCYTPCHTRRWRPGFLSSEDGSYCLGLWIASNTGLAQTLFRATQTLGGDMEVRKRLCQSRSSWRRKRLHQHLRQ